MSSKEEDTRDMREAIRALTEEVRKMQRSRSSPWHDERSRSRRSRDRRSRSGRARDRRSHRSRSRDQRSRNGRSSHRGYSRDRRRSRSSRRSLQRHDRGDARSSSRVSQCSRGSRCSRLRSRYRSQHRSRSRSSGRDIRSPTERSGDGRDVRSSHPRDDSQPKDIAAAVGLQSAKEQDGVAVAVQPAEEKNTESNGSAEPQIEAALLSLLGDDMTGSQTGPKLHTQVAERWTNILQKGLEKEARQDLLKKYPTSENCLLMKAPTLNPEVKASLSPHLIKKEFYQVAAQNQLAAAIGATGTALTEVLMQESVDKDRMVGFLGDTGRILTDLQHTLSVARRAGIIPTVNPLVKSMAEECPIDSLLFGESFSEKFKAAQALEKSAKAVSKPSPAARPTPNPKQQTAARGRGDTGRLNFKGPPRKPYGKSYANHHQGGPSKSRQNSSNRRQH